MPRGTMDEDVCGVVDERAGGDGAPGAGSVGDADGPRDKRDERKLNASTKKDIAAARAERSAEGVRGSGTVSL